MKDAVANVMSEVAEKQAAQKADLNAARARALRRARRAWPLLILVAAAFLISFIYFVPRWNHPFKPPVGAAAMRDARQAILFADGHVILFLTANGRAPASLAETGVNLPGITYRVTPRGYELSAVVEGRRIVFTSGEDRERFLAGQP